MAFRIPAIGERVTWEDMFAERTRTGEVIDLLSVQFMVRCDDKVVRFCFYASDWRVKEEGVAAEKGGDTVSVL